MIFYLLDYLSSKSNKLKENNRKKPNKLKYIVIWLTLIIIINIIFYYLGLFNRSSQTPLTENIIKKIKPPKIISKNNSFRNNINYERIDKKVLDIVPKENIEAIESILNDVKNMQIPKPTLIDEYNFE